MTRPNQKALTPELRRLLPLPSCEEFNGKSITVTV